VLFRTSGGCSVAAVARAGAPRVTVDGTNARRWSTRRRSAFNAVRGFRFSRARRQLRACHEAFPFTRSGRRLVSTCRLRFRGCGRNFSEGKKPGWHKCPACARPRLHFFEPDGAAPQGVQGRSARLRHGHSNAAARLFVVGSDVRVRAFAPCAAATRLISQLKRGRRCTGGGARRVVKSMQQRMIDGCASQRVHGAGEAVGAERHAFYRPPPGRRSSRRASRGDEIRRRAPLIVRFFQEQDGPKAPDRD
jgi:hypothetical protein